MFRMPAQPIHRCLKPSTRLRLEVDGVEILTTAKQLRYGPNAALSVALYDLEAEHLLNGATRRTAQHYDYLLNRALMITLEIEQPK